MKLIIAGSRHLNVPLQFIEWCVNRFSIPLESLEVVSGTAKGIDSSGEIYAEAAGHALHKFPADWEKHGKAAGYFRNSDMAEYADALLLIWDGESKGSAMMKYLMEKQDKPIYEIILKQDMTNVRLY